MAHPCPGLVENRVRAAVVMYVLPVFDFISHRLDFDEGMNLYERKRRVRKPVIRPDPKTLARLRVTIQNLGIPTPRRHLP
jgi:hypothetical protein